MNANHNLFFLLLFLGLFGTERLWAQQLVQTTLRKDAGETRSTFVNASYLHHWSLYRDRIELKELAAGQGGYAEFSFDDLENSDLTVGLRHATDASQTWAFRFLNGQISVNGVNLGNCVNGTVYRVERCDASIVFYGGAAVLTELPLNDINFVAWAIVEVNATAPVNGQHPSLTLEFPFLNSCQSSPPGTTATSAYPGLKKKLDGTFVRLTGPVLRFKYEEDYAIVAGQNEVLEYQIYDWDQAPPAPPNQAGSLTKRMGVNYLSINLSGITTNRYYTLAVKDSRGDPQYLRFLYYCPPGQNCIIFDGGGKTEFHRPVLPPSTLLTDD